MCTYTYRRVCQFHIAKALINSPSLPFLLSFSLKSSSMRSCKREDSIQPCTCWSGYAYFITTYRIKKIYPDISKKKEKWDITAFRVDVVVVCKRITTWDRVCTFSRVMVDEPESSCWSIKKEHQDLNELLALIAMAFQSLSLNWVRKERQRKPRRSNHFFATCCKESFSGSVYYSSTSFSIPLSISVTTTINVSSGAGPGTRTQLHLHTVQSVVYVPVSVYK